jgi:hypothetical protein
LSHRAFNSSSWRVLAEKLPVGKKSLQSINICKHYVTKDYFICA